MNCARHIHKRRRYLLETKCLFIDENGKVINRYDLEGDRRLSLLILAPNGDKFQIFSIEFGINRYVRECNAR